MDKFCVNCGHELNEGADYCLGCGKRLKKNYQREIRKNQNSKEVLNVIGMIFGIISFFIIFSLNLSLGEVSYIIHDELLITKFFVASVWMTLSFVPALIGFIVSLISIKREKSVYSIIGIITSIVSFMFISLSVIYLIK